MKKIIIALAAFALTACVNVEATSHAHRHALAKAGCTQVQEANGECPALQIKVDPMAAAREWDRQHNADNRDSAAVVKRGPHGVRCDRPLPVDAVNEDRAWVDHNCD